MLRPAIMARPAGIAGAGAVRGVTGAARSWAVTA